MAGSFSASAGAGRHAVTAEAAFIGRDVMAALHGGERPHVGAVALASPCTSGDTDVRAYASVISAPGHRDDVLAHRLSLAMSRELGRTVCMAAGIHVGNATGEDIRQLVRNVEDAARKLTNILKEQIHGS